MSPFKRKICFFTATTDWKQILSSNVELCQITGSQKKALAQKELWWVWSCWETAEMGRLWCWREGKMTGDSETPSFLRQVCLFISFLCVPSKVSQCTGSHILLGRAQAKAAASTPTSYSTVKAPCASPLRVPSLEINWCKCSILFANFGRKYIMCLKSFLKDEVGERKKQEIEPNSRMFLKINDKNRLLLLFLHLLNICFWGGLSAGNSFSC